MSRFDREHVLLELIAALSILTATLVKFSVPYIDQQITADLVARLTPWEILTRLPLLQAHYPTWYFIPEFFGMAGATALSVVSFPVTVVALGLTAHAVYDDFRSAYAAAFLAVFSPMLATQAGWGRMYAPLTALLSVTLYLTITKRWRWAVASSLVAAAIHPFGIFGAIWVSIQAYRDDAGWARFVALPPAIVLVVFLSIKLGRNNVDSVAHAVSYAAGTVPTTTGTLIAPVASIAGSPSSLAHIMMMMLLLLLAWDFEADRRLLTFVALPILGIATASYLVLPVFRLKYMTIAAPGVIVLLASNNRPVVRQVALYSGIAMLYLLGWYLRAHRALNIRRYIIPYLHAAL